MAEKVAAFGLRLLPLRSILLDVIHYFLILQLVFLGIILYLIILLSSQNINNMGPWAALLFGEWRWFLFYCSSISLFISPITSFLSI